MSHRFFTVLIIYCMFGILLSCKSDPPPPATPPTSDTLVIIVGGLGSDCTRHMAEEIDARCPRALVIPVGKWDAYKVDIRPILFSLPKKHTVLVLHSFAAWHVSESLPPVDYVVLLDPVSPTRTGLWSDTLPYPAYAARVDVYNRSGWWGPRVAGIPGTVPIIVNASHNKLPEDPTTIERTIAAINAM